MSCGNPHDVDCREVLEEVYLYLDGELDADQQAVVKVHLEECSPCLRKYGIEQEVKALVARCCGNDVAPAGLRERVLATLRAVHVDAMRSDGSTVEFTSVDVTSLEYPPE